MREAAREAHPDDVERIAALATEAVAEQEDGRGGWVWARREVRPKPFTLSVTDALVDPDRSVWVGTIDDVIVGYSVVALEVLQTGELLGRIEDIYVTPRAREVSVGKQLVDAALTWCGERSCVGIDAQALPGNRETKNFFESFGFTARLITVHRTLTRGPANGPTS